MTARPGFDFRGRPIREVARDALHRTPGVECDHVDYREPCCERDGAQVGKAIEAHLLSDETAARAGFVSWVVHLEQQGLQASDAEWQFGWDHLPPSHRDAWVARARRIVKAAVGS